MKIRIDLLKRDYKVIGLTLLTGFFLGWLFFHDSGNKAASGQATDEHAQEKNTIWTCSMHPQIRMDHPGKCPICGMDLVPLQENAGSETAISPDEIQMTDAAIKIADIQTLVAQKAYPDKEVYLLGKVMPDERNISELTARFGGRIEKLHVNFTGQKVDKGEKLVTIYSPALVTAQKELLESREYKQSNPEFYKATRNKLKLWDLTDEQIDNIEQKGEAQSYFDVLSPITGTVTKRNVALGDYVKEGSALFQVIDLTKVWIMFEAYESDLPWIKLDDKVKFTIRSLPGNNFNGRVSFIDPFIDPKTRIAQVRVEVQNPGLVLKPEMFANGVVTSSIASKQKDLMIPKTSILWTGKRAVVYVKVPNREQPTFKYREIVLGPSAGEFYVVKEGLSAGEEIAVNGVFKIDAAAQLAGKPSMMNPEGDRTASGYNHTGLSKGSLEDQSYDQNPAISAGKNHGDTSKHKSNSEIRQQATSKVFKRQLTAAYYNYLAMKNDFVSSNPDQVAQSAENVTSSLNKVDMNLPKDESHLAWMSQLEKLKDSLRKIMQSRDIKVQREAFAVFNQVFYQSVKDFGLEGVTTYYQYCPMAVGQKGAFWFSENGDIKNPYFGESMLTCGETKDTLKY
jgi:Cu(I)/Ag(I) efflux system membrane fusion protein